MHVPDTYVYVTEEGVTRHYADGSVEALAWEDVVEVRVGGVTEVRRASSSWRTGRGDNCVVPRSATDATFLARLRYLPDFDLERLSWAVENADDGYVVVLAQPRSAPSAPGFGIRLAKITPDSDIE